MVMVGQSATVVHAPPQFWMVWCWQLPFCGLQLSAVHGLLSLQVLVVPAQAPAVQVSFCVQLLLSSHWPPLSGVCRQLPVAASQLSVVHVFWSLQFFWLKAVHLPFKHASLVVQASPSLQVVPFCTFCTTHCLLFCEHTAVVQVLPVPGQSALVLQLPPQPAIGVNRH